MELLVTGGTGLVGNALQKVCPEAIYVSSKDYDLTKEVEAKAMFEKYRPANVIHLAARVGDIIENMSYPAEFIHQNVLMNTYVVHYANKYKVKKLMGLISNCAYPDKVEKYPMVESQLHDGLPAITNFSYAYSKRTLEVQIKAYRSQYGRNYFSVIPVIYTAMAYPGSQLYDDAVQQGVKLPEKWHGYAQYSEETLPLPTKYLSAADVLRFRDNAFKEYFKNPKYLEMIKEKFGSKVVEHIKEMLKHEIHRKFV